MFLSLCPLHPSHHSLSVHPAFLLYQLHLPYLASYCVFFHKSAFLIMFFPLFFCHSGLFLFFFTTFTYVNHISSVSFHCGPCHRYQFFASFLSALPSPPRYNQLVLQAPLLPHNVYLHLYLLISTQSSFLLLLVPPSSSYNQFFTLHTNQLYTHNNSLHPHC